MSWTVGSPADMSSFQARGSMANMWRDPFGFPFQTEVWESQYNKSKFDSDSSGLQGRSSQVIHWSFQTTGLVGDWWLVAVCSWLAWILRHWSRPGLHHAAFLVPRFIVRAVSTKQSLFFGTTWLQTQQSSHILRNLEDIILKTCKTTINDPTGSRICCCFLACCCWG